MGCDLTGGDDGALADPEPEAAAHYGITEVGWVDLRDETTWNAQIVQDPITYPLLQRLRSALGYAEA